MTAVVVPRVWCNNWPGAREHGIHLRGASGRKIARQDSRCHEQMRADQLPDEALPRLPSTLPCPAKRSELRPEVSEISHGRGADLLDHGTVAWGRRAADDERDFLR